VYKERVAEGLPDDVSRFIDAHISSVEQLEGLLILKNEPDASRSAGDIAKRLYTSEDSVRDRLDDLHSQGLVGRDRDGYSFAPRNQKLRDDIEKLAEFYAKRKVAVINQIFAGPSDDVQSFADAFRLRKDKD
jgi:predicted ArsR family transcriptional regulator